MSNEVRACFHGSPRMCTFQEECPRIARLAASVLTQQIRIGYCDLPASPAKARRALRTSAVLWACWANYRRDRGFPVSFAEIKSPGRKPTGLFFSPEPGWGVYPDGVVHTLQIVVYPQTPR